MPARADTPLPPRTRLSERYELLMPMASGGMASVWCGRDRLLDRTVAIKLMAESLSTDPAAARRFKREARAAARLSGHPNVITIYDVGQTAPGVESAGGRPFIVMERLLGGTVADALRAAPVKAHRSLKWLREAAGAIDFAHRRGVIHRDIKPSNFLLDAGRVLHVADFGIALVATDETLTFTGQLLGTAAYLAPEVALGQPAATGSDLYALAVAAFELLTGQRPFLARHFAAQARQHIETPPPNASERNPALPAGLDGVLARGMAKRPEQRFPSAGELVAAVDAALAPRPRPRTAAPPRASTAATTRQAQATALVALLVLLAGVAGAAIGAGAGSRSAFLARGVSGSGVPERHHPHGSLTYANALYDLGRSLRLAGDPQAGDPGPRPGHHKSGGGSPSPGPRQGHEHGGDGGD